jgi:FtsP/CotA-like multicopper oxidase with cupredoxin domain
MRLPLAAQKTNQHEAVQSAQTAVPRIEPNDNRLPAGKLQDGTLTIHLEIREGQWFPEADSGPSLKIQAFAPEGKLPQIPGPLIRVPQGTEVHATVRNALGRGTAVVHGLYQRPSERAETVEVPTGELREIRFKVHAPGTYYYWASTTGQPLEVREGLDSQLSGALIVDPPNTPVNDRVFVMDKWASPHPLGDPLRRVVFVINGKSWPYNEKLTHKVGDEVRWRWINPTNRVHPMHLHGFYFRVDSTGDEARDEIYKPEDRRRAVTERMPIGGTMSTTWVPERQGRWIFHCHIQAHFSPDLGLEGAEAQPASHAAAHAELGDESGMKGLVVGITVLPAEAAEQKAAPAAEPRQIRLLVRERPATWDSPRAHVYQLQEGSEQPAVERATVPGSPIVLTRGEPVEITVVNQLKQPTAVHWHGIEIESYYDGVPGWGGYLREVTPPIEPGKSFLVKITPQRAGTFIYHTHWHEALQLSTGLYGPLIVLESGQKFDLETDKIFILSRGGSDPLRAPVLLNGSAQPRVQRLKKGVKYRLRFINITDNLASETVSLLAGSSLVNWRLTAKDGAYLPANQSVLRPAKQIVAVGETYDFEFQQDQEADLRLEVLHPVERTRVVAELQVR